MKAKEFFEKIGFNELSEIQEKVLNSNKNILILGSCGSGKTEAMLSKLIEWDDKGILIEPMKTLASSLKDRLNYYSDILHLDSWTIQHSSDSEDKFLSNKYCVTTIDQILSGYLAIGMQSFIRGKNVLRSNLVFDEVQLFDPDKMLLTTINMLKDINKLGNKFIIMTATMPEYLINFLKDEFNMDVIISETVRVKNRKNTIRYVDVLNYKEINNYQNKQIIICNTIKSMKEIYSKLDKDRVIILNSKFLKNDREKIEKEMLYYFGKDSTENNKILLTTQIVEAGMDISANRLYSEACPIDNLVQRDGRCARWGGLGEVIVFNSNESKNIYNTEIVQKTSEYIIKNQGIEFSWDIQKQWINEILNDFYKEKINNIQLECNKVDFRFTDRNKLIRCIKNVNIIVRNDELTKEDFKRASISISLNELDKIALHNNLYILNKGRIEEKGVASIDIGETIIIQGNNCVYDKLGFRYEENVFIDDNFIDDFPLIETDDLKFDDYVIETWLEHATSVKNKMKERLEKENFNDYIINNINDISFYAGLHDLGKLDKEWLSKAPGNIPLAHFPFNPKARKAAKRDHAAISYYNIKDYTDKIIANMVLQHHGRYSTGQAHRITTTPWDFHNNSKSILQEYGFIEDINYSSKDKIIKNKEVITPAKDEWITLLYLTGTLMECEIDAIKKHILKHK
ncbi:CRISPR-associated helicase Cas3' [Clostridium mediterraneense]|uniref:CRISPR-associated helicase Cas3' n=1 Tax=Clostridium mediterraneense TaxID=1805472 RepID=UPI000830BAA5|nr:CRISPR-associated helicase Cas3' [Clostridium mediterraneense]